MIPDWLSWIDVASLAAVVLFSLSGAQRGFAGQVAQVVTFLVLGITLFFAYPALFSYFGKLFRNLNETYMMWLILAGLGVLTLLFFVFISKLLADMIKTQMTPRSDHIYGFILGLVRGVLLTLFALVFLVILGPPEVFDGLRAKSQVGKLVCYEMVPRIQPHMTRAVFEEQVDALRQTLNQQRGEAGQIEGF